jgi:hypothetical protein
VDYVASEGKPVTVEYALEQPPQPGQWITVDGVHLIVERARKETAFGVYDGVAFCRVASERPPLVGG